LRLLATSTCFPSGAHVGPEMSGESASTTRHNSSSLPDLSRNFYVGKLSRFIISYYFSMAYSTSIIVLFFGLRYNDDAFSRVRKPNARVKPGR
jgi:hypothetical protein